MAVFIPSKIESYLKTSTKGCLFQHSYAVLNTMTEYALIIKTITLDLELLLLDEINNETRSIISVYCLMK